MKLLDRTLHQFKNEDKRTGVVRKNILYSAFLKIVGLGCSLLIVPVTLDYLNKEIYGIWLTMSSILYWFSFFDVGLGNGMRNYLAEAFSKHDFDKARSYISTTLVLLLCVALLIALISIIPVCILDMNRVFNTYSIPGSELRKVLIVALVFTFALFVVKNIGLVFVAMQRYAVNDFLGVAGNVLALFVIYILTKTTSSNLMYVVLAFTGIPVLVFLLSAIPIFKKYKNLRPTYKSIDCGLGLKIIGKGLGFFFIQITSCLVIYGSSNLFITQFVGPSDVTVYNIAYKFFNLLAIGYTVVLSPMWNAYTDAYVKKDMGWIQTTFNKALRMWGISFAIGVVMLVFCSCFYSLWVGKAVSVPFMLSVSVFLYIEMFNLNNCVTYLLNGLNKIRVQIYTSILFTVLYVVMVVMFGHAFGTVGIVLSMALCYGLMALIHFYQCRLLITQKAEGIWNI